MPPFEIRIFETKDADAVVKLASNYAAFDRAMPKDWLPSTFKEHPKSIWVAVTGTKVIGFAIGLETKTPTGNIWGNIELIAVHPTHRKKGIGTRLIEKLIEEFKNAKAEQAVLFCPAEAKEAKKLYERLGFKVNAYHMRKKLYLSNMKRHFQQHRRCLLTT